MAFHNTPGFLIHGVWGNRKSSIFGVWVALGGRETLQKYGGRSPPHFRRPSRAPGAGQTSKTHPQKSGQTAFTGYLKAVWPEICGSVFGRFSAKLGPKTPLDRRGSSCSADRTKHQPRRPILRSRNRKVGNQMGTTKNQQQPQKLRDPARA